MTRRDEADAFRTWHADGVAGWEQFAAHAPAIAEVFLRRHAATGNLCMLGTLRPDGFPRISPMEPRFFEGDLWLAGMPHTAKFDDLARDPRFTLHTATVDTHVSDGDAKLWGTVEDVHDEALHQRFAEAVYAEIGLDIRGQPFEHCYQAGITGAAAVTLLDGHLDVTTWREGRPETVIRKH
ncbi:pyridoxamine 5'-phosphate oxidase family protein [Actinomycetospora sp.]|uniref:pyridoxamine 5'-phosphate oxidase family protein n=1 Tax=Actinomycetospora sp. TaxID=1872135 RepID=UPI002F405A8D